MRTNLRKVIMNCQRMKKLKKIKMKNMMSYRLISSSFQELLINWLYRLHSYVYLGQFDFLKVGTVLNITCMDWMYLFCTNHSLIMFQYILFENASLTFAIKANCLNIKKIQIERWLLKHFCKFRSSCSGAKCSNGTNYLKNS